MEYLVLKESGRLYGKFTVFSHGLSNRGYKVGFDRFDLLHSRLDEFYEGRLRLPSSELWQRQMAKGKVTLWQAESDYDGPKRTKPR